VNENADEVATHVLVPMSIAERLKDLAKEDAGDAERIPEGSGLRPLEESTRKRPPTRACARAMERMGSRDKEVGHGQGNADRQRTAPPFGIKLASGELAFDFTARKPANPSPTLDWKDREKVGVKEAIVRWLEEQL